VDASSAVRSFLIQNHEKRGDGIPPCYQHENAFVCPDPSLINLKYHQRLTTLLITTKFSAVGLFPIQPNLTGEAEAFTLITSKQGNARFESYQMLGQKGRMPDKKDINEIKKERSGFFSDKVRTTSQGSDDTIGVSDWQKTEAEAVKQSRERVGELQSQKSKKK